MCAVGEGPRASERETDRLTDQSWEQGERCPEPCTSCSLPALSFPLLFLKPCLFPGLPAIVHVFARPCGVYGPCVCCVCSSACDVLYGVVFVRCGGCGVCGVVCVVCYVLCVVWFGMCVCVVWCVLCVTCVVCVVWSVWYGVCFMCVVRCGICVCVVWCVLCVMCVVCVVWCYV